MQYAAQTFLGIRIPMRDGAELAADLYLPPGGTSLEALPVIVNHTPYQATCSRDRGSMQWVARGLAALCVDCRGRGNATGSFVPWEKDVEDAYDLLEWIFRQPWCNGRVGMVGGSYPAVTQLAALCSGHPALCAAAPSAIAGDAYDIYYTNGAQELSFMMPWHIGICRPLAKPPALLPFADYKAVRTLLPLADLADLASTPCPSWKAIATHDGRDAYWQGRSHLDCLKRSDAGIFYQGGWFDVLCEKMFETFAAMTRDSAGDDAGSARRFNCMRVGPWGHGVNTPEGETTFGPDAIVTDEVEVDFLTKLLGGGTPATAANPGPVQIFVMGRNIWRFENEWPLARTRYTPLYLRGNGRAATAAGDGLLAWNPPVSDEPADNFTYDPANPVPTCGGRIVGAGGQRDQTAVEARPDVLVYTSAPLDHDLEVTGQVRMRLYAATSAPDTDFTVKLVDAAPGRPPFNVCDGILRVRFRDGLEQPARLAVPGEVMELDIEVDVTSYCFLAGHAIRVEISSSNFPRFARNPNTGAPVAAETHLECARQTICHSRRHPSHLILPVIP